MSALTENGFPTSALFFPNSQPRKPVQRFFRGCKPLSEQMKVLAMKPAIAAVLYLSLFFFYMKSQCSNTPQGPELRLRCQWRGHGHPGQGAVESTGLQQTLLAVPEPSSLFSNKTEAKDPGIVLILPLAFHSNISSGPWLGWKIKKDKGLWGLQKQ